MDNENLDLPASVSGALRSVPAPDPSLREAHIAAALAAFDTGTRHTAGITRIDSRRRVMLSTAAAALLVVGAGIGWVVHSPRATPVAADVSVAPEGIDASDNSAPSTTVAKGSSAAAPAPTQGDAFVTSATVPKCTNGELRMIDSVYLGEYVNPVDNHTYLVFRFDGRLEFVDKDTCQMVNLSATTTVP